jgi:quercetin dioxygenase-like cupin family protein
MATAQTKTSLKSAAGLEFIEGTLSKPLLQFDLASELKRLHSEESWLQATGRSSKTLAKYPDLRIVLIAMKSNTRMQGHTAAARISVHTLSGHIRLRRPEQVVDLPAGHLLTLDRSVPHDVEATEDSAFLLTLSWPRERKMEQSKTRRRKMIRRKAK